MSSFSEASRSDIFEDEDSFDQMFLAQDEEQRMYWDSVRETVNELLIEDDMEELK